jgi:hypothetical protein
MALYDVTYHWEQGEMIVHKPHQGTADVMVAFVKSLVALRPKRGFSDSEICYSTSGWTQVEMDTVLAGLDACGISRQIVAKELVVEKRDESAVDKVISVVTGDAPSFA